LGRSFIELWERKSNKFNISIFYEAEMYFETILVTAGAGFLTIGLILSNDIVRTLKKQKLATPWVILRLLISFFFFAYAFMAARFAGVDVFPSISNGSIVALVFFFGSVFVVILTFLNRDLFTNIFGVQISDRKAITRFLRFTKMGAELDATQLTKKYSIRCDNCGKVVRYSLADIVRAHPHLERGIILEQAFGGKNFTMYLRHRCKDGFREIPVFHDCRLEYRSQKPSRLL
jgi:hypothetical protein